MPIPLGHALLRFPRGLPKSGALRSLAARATGSVMKSGGITASMARRVMAVGFPCWRSTSRTVLGGMDAARPNVCAVHPMCRAKAQIR